ncbi:toxin-antitoxin system YwqK family antitoxin, partial [Helicobacter pullorum]|uniref:toxin-antitoxin system YwqK family antitoxin n=1 Tax=Helicobacter pullorum TaxID=35818 RepID=UPI003AFFBAB5
TLKYKNIIDNGKITKMINYYPNGNIKAELILKDDEIVFYTSRYENGNLHFMIPLVNKKYNGNIIVYYENGKIALQGNLKDGEIIDYFYIFQRNGMLKYKYNNYEVLKVNEDNLLLEPIKIESEIQEFKICLSQLIKIEDYNIKE